MQVMEAGCLVLLVVRTEAGSSMLAPCRWPLGQSLDPPYLPLGASLLLARGQRMGSELSRCCRQRDISTTRLVATGMRCCTMGITTLYRLAYVHNTNP